MLADASGAGAERFLLGGDYALFGPWPAETIDQLRSLRNATWIRGNVDRWTAEPWGTKERFENAKAWATRGARKP